eukprot:m.9706 g.9706  ORF g.9706 m.9706 type:complete len:211 (+) comp2667_c0_seq1:221-853(+)
MAGSNRQHQRSRMPCRRLVLGLGLVALAVLVAGDASGQRDGRGIGLTEEERASAAEALEAEEAARLAKTAADKEARAKKELEKMQHRVKKQREVEKRAKAQEAAAASQPTLIKKATPAPQASEKAASEEEDSELLRRARAIGLTDEQRAAHEKELQLEEDRRFAVPKSAKEDRARRELEKLNKRAGVKKSKNKSKRRKKKRTKKVPKTDL